MSLPSGVSAGTVTVSSQPNSPIQIKYCWIGYEDSSAGSKNYFLGQAVSFTNMGAQDVVAIEFEFDLLDNFGDKVGTLTGQKTGTFSPQVLIDVQRNVFTGLPLKWEWETINTWPGLATVTCSVRRAKFADGTIWRESGSGDG